MSDRRPINWASIENGAYASSDCCDSGRDYPLRSENTVDDDQCSATPAANTYMVHFIKPVIIDTFIVRLYYKDSRAYTFNCFESSVDGVYWSAVIAPDTSYSQGFDVTIPGGRLMKQVRLRAVNTQNAWLHLVRFQAFSVNLQDSQDRY